MLEQILQYLQNWFPIEKRPGTYTIEGGGISLPFLKPGQYFRIMNSALNDGVYQYGDGLELADETFDGSIWALAVPKAILMMLPDIEAWNAKYAAVAASPYTSESYGNYSYSKASSGDTGGGWQSAFAAQLAPWRKL